MIEKRSIGDSGIEVAPFALGGNVFGWTADEKASFAVLDAFVDAGGTMIDTADVYSAWVPGHVGGESETVIGRWLKRDPSKRSKVVIATKVGFYNGLAPDTIGPACDASLRRLGIETIDLYYHHKDDPGVPLPNSLGAVDALLKAGKVRAVGQEHELGDGQRVELHPVAVALAHGGEEVAVVVERQLRVEAAVEADQVAAELEQLVDLREHVAAVEDVAALLVRQDVERTVVTLGNADVRVIDDAHDHVRRLVGLVPARARPLRELLQLVVRRAVPKPCCLVSRDAGHAGTASSTVTSSGSSVSMKELTEKTALPAPATP